MSFQEQLKQISNGVSSSFSTDFMRRRSLVYDQPKTIDTHTCYADSLRAFRKLSEVDPELNRFEETLFSPNTLRLQMCNLLPLHKRSIDEQIDLFFFLIDKHVRSSEALWALEWPVYKFEVPRYYTDALMRLIIPHYESGLFAKGIQLLDFKDTSSDWLWLQPYAERGTPLSRQEFLRSCCHKSSLISFIGTSMICYAKFESELRLNRISHFSNFFTYTVVGLCELGLQANKMVKIVKALQGTIRKGLRSDILAFQSSATCVVLRLSLFLPLNCDLIMDWINCILKSTIKGNEWNSIKSVRVLMQSQGITVLPDELSTLYEGVLKELSPLDRAAIEMEDERQLTSGDLNAVASTSLEQSERVQKATMIMDAEMLESALSRKEPVVAEKKKSRKLTVKRVLKMAREDLFSSDSEMQEQFKIVHRILGQYGICIADKSNCDCTSKPTPAEVPADSWLADFLIATLVSFTQSGSLESAANLEDAVTALRLRQCQVALQIVRDTLVLPQPFSSTSSKPLLDPLNNGFPCVLSALLHPIGEVRGAAYETLDLYLTEFSKLSDRSAFNFVNNFLADVQGNANVISDSTKSLLQGDSLSALVRTTTDLVQAVFRLFCSQPLNDDSFSRMCWFSAAQLLQNDLLQSIIQLEPAAGNGSGAKCGWEALLLLLRSPPTERFEMVHQLCIGKLDAFTLPTLAALSLCNLNQKNPKESGGTSLYENELLNALIDFDCPNRSIDTRLAATLSKLLLKVEHYAYLLEKLDPGLRCDSQSLSSRLVNRNNQRNDAFEMKRLSALQVVLTSLVADMHRLESTALTEKRETLSRENSSTSLSSFVSGLKCGAKRRKSSNRGKLSADDDSIKENESGLSKKKDLVHPLNSHLLSCISLESRLRAENKRRQRTSEAFASDSGEDETDEGVVDDDSAPEPTATNTNDNLSTTFLQAQALNCVLEILVTLTNLSEVGNKLKVAEKTRSPQISSLMPTCSVTTAVNTIFNCLHMFESSTAIQRQAILCLVEMASLFPVIVCQHLFTLVRWIGGADNKTSIFLQLDNIQNLRLIDRLISTAVPALVKASKTRVEAGLKVLDVFVRGLPDLPTNYPRRCLALYAGLLRGLADVTAPTPTISPETSDNVSTLGLSKRVNKQVALPGWLWTAAVAFFNVNYASQETADLVFPLLTDLFNQFDLSVQLTAWQQCFKFYLFLISRLSCVNSKKMQANKPKRPRLDKSVDFPSPVTKQSSFDCDYSYLLKLLSKSEEDKDRITLFTLSKRRRSGDYSSNSGDGIRLWSLLGNISAFFTTLLESSGHLLRQKNAIEQGSLEAVQDSFGEIVQLTIQLLISSTASTIEGNESEDNITCKDAVVNLQSLLVKMNSLMSTRVFLDSVIRLMSFDQSNLTKKALELLLAKLESLTMKFPNAFQLLTRQATALKPPPKMGEVLERGLVDIVDKLSYSIITSNNILSSDRNFAKIIQLRISCLRKLSQLLCKSYPSKMVKVLDHLLSISASSWWPSVDEAAIKTNRMATDAAEARSMVCLFAFECLAHLPPELVSIRGVTTSSVTRTRIRRALRFALDHSSIACHLTDRPMGSPTAAAGKFHSCEQHLQAGVTLLLGAFEFSTRMNRIDQSEAVMQILREEIPDDHPKLNGYMGFSEALDSSLLIFVFRTTHLDLSSATHAKADRSSVALKQSAAIIHRLRNQLVLLPESLYLLRLTYDLLKDAKTDTDLFLLSGGLEFISRHADRVFSNAAREDVDLDSSRPGEGLNNALDATYVADPLLVWNILCLALECRPTQVSEDSNASAQNCNTIVAKAAAMAGSSLLAALNHDNRLQLIGQCLRWLVDENPVASVVMARLQSFYVILDRLASQLPPSCFVNLIKDASLVNLFVCSLSLLSGEHRSKSVKQLAAQLELPHLLTCFSTGIPKAFGSIASACARAAYAAISAWLRAESSLSACLDTAGTDSVLTLPQVLALPLGAAGLGLSEVDLVPCVAAFLGAIAGDEALLRPFAASLCALVTRKSQWRTRLSALRLLKQTFDTLMEGNVGKVDRSGSRDLGLAACLRSDILASLSEAMEDEKPEVEAAANRLFADLEAAGAVMESGD